MRNCLTLPLPDSTAPAGPGPGLGLRVRDSGKTSRRTPSNAPSALSVRRPLPTKLHPIKPFLTHVRRLEWEKMAAGSGSELWLAPADRISTSLLIAFAQARLPTGRSVTVPASDYPRERMGWAACNTVALARRLHGHSRAASRGTFPPAHSRGGDRRSPGPHGTSQPAFESTARRTGPESGHPPRIPKPPRSRPAAVRCPRRQALSARDPPALDTLRPVHGHGKPRPGPGPKPLRRRRGARASRTCEGPGRRGPGPGSRATIQWRLRDVARRHERDVIRYHSRDVIRHHSRHVIRCHLRDVMRCNKRDAIRCHKWDVIRRQLRATSRHLRDVIGLVSESLEGHEPAHQPLVVHLPHVLLLRRRRRPLRDRRGARRRRGRRRLARRPGRSGTTAC